MAFVDTVMNLQFPYKTRRFLDCFKYLLFYEGVVLHGRIYMYNREERPLVLFISSFLLKDTKECERNMKILHSERSF